MTEQNTNKDGEGVKRYKWEYSQFLEMVREKKPENAIIYAQALGIDRRTLVHWLSQPELREALLNTLDELVQGMKEAGKKDWRMHRELMNILGIKEVKGVDLTTDGEKINNPITQLTEEELRKLAGK